MAMPAMSIISHRFHTAMGIHPAPLARPLSRGLLRQGKTLYLVPQPLIPAFKLQGCGGGSAAIFKWAMPEGRRGAGFPFRISYHRLFDRERKRSLDFARDDVTGNPSHWSLAT